MSRANATNDHRPGQRPLLRALRQDRRTHQSRSPEESAQGLRSRRGTHHLPPGRGSGTRTGKAKAEIGDLAVDMDDLVLYAIYPVTGKKFLQWKYGKEEPPKEVKAISLEEAKAKRIWSAKPAKVRWSKRPNWPKCRAGRKMRASSTSLSMMIALKSPLMKWADPRSSTSCKPAARFRRHRQVLRRRRSPLPPPPRRLPHRQRRLLRHLLLPPPRRLPQHPLRRRLPTAPR